MTASLKIILSLQHTKFCARDAPFPFYVILYSNITYAKGQQQNFLPCSEVTHTHTHTHTYVCFFSFDSSCNKTAGLLVRANRKQ